MSRPDAIRLPSFWWFQTSGWVCFCVLSLLVVLPYFRRPAALGYQGLLSLLADQLLMCLGVFLASLALRPVCRSLLRKPFSFLSLEGHAAGWSLAIATATTLISSRFFAGQPEPMELFEACTKMFLLLFLWCNLYFNIRRFARPAGHPERFPVEAGAPQESAREYASRFTVRTGSRIQVVSADDLEWIAAAGDYSELHTRRGTHLLRETMNSLERKLDPARFARIHRSRIVSLKRILELRAIENREYLVKLADGSQHRASRTYADRIASWLDSQR